MNVNTKEIYSEVYGILNLLGEDYISKLPKSLFEMIEDEKSSTYNPQYNETEILNAKNIKRESMAMIALFHLNYWCNSDEEKKELKQLFKDNEAKAQVEIREKYNTNNLFERRKQETIVKTKAISSNVAMVEYKDSLFRRFINKILKLFTLH